MATVSFENILQADAANYTFLSGNDNSRLPRFSAMAAETSSFKSPIGMSETRLSRGSADASSVG